MTGNVLVLRAGALGDTILTLPALHALRARAPSARLRIVGYPASWSVAGPLADEIVSIDSPLFATLSTGAPSSELRAFLQDVDLLIAWTARDPVPALKAAGVPRVIHASPYPPPGVHAAEWLLRSLPHGPSLDLQTWRLQLTPEETERARSILAALGVERPAIVHPGAGARWKRWPAERFAQVAQELAGRGQAVLLVEGPADAEAVAAMQDHMAHPLPVLRDLPPRHLAAMLARASLFVGNDSGVTHLAGAVGAPTVALFGPSDPRSWASLGRTKVVRSCRTRTIRQGQLRVCEDPDCMAGIAVEDVLRELQLY